MICNRCEQYIPENSRSIAKGYCRHCHRAMQYWRNESGQKKRI